ncbi:MAG: isomerizing glutamine--fructose-6-phosphate transaminase [Chloroflexi bacterium]|nr:isomerizing glutamine--fructose-6-phosphate transaminase [Chloroflexota bacterium]
MSKGGFDHYMLKEIHEQPEAIRDTVAESLLGPATAGTSSPVGYLPVRDPDAVLLLGCGTSYHAALMGEQILSQLLTVPVTARVASEFQKPAVKAEQGLVVAFSQSGETSDTLTALRRILGQGYASLGVTNVMGSSITRAVDATLYTRAGPEVAVASTKTFLCQLVTLYLLGFHLATDRDAVSIIPQNLQVLPDLVRQVLSRDSAIQQAVRQLTKAEHIFIIGKGLGVPIALEGALKFKEVAYLPTEGYPAGELKHGPFALLGEKTPVIAMVLADEHRSRMITSIKEIKARGSTVIAIADRGDGEVAEFADMVLPVPKTDPLLAPVLHNVVLQLMSYYCARKLGCPIDRPRNLAKSVTVP